MKKGCLVIALIFVLLIGGAVFFVGKLAKNMMAMANEMEQLVKHVQQESDKLNQDFPFQEPEGFVLDPDRFDVYTNIRNAANDTLTQTELYNIFAKGEFSFSTIIHMSDTLVSSSRQVVDRLLDELGQNKMAFDEYSYINKIVSGVVVSEVEAGNPSSIIPADIVEKINKMNESGNKQEDLFKYTREALKDMDQQTHNEILAQIQPKLSELFGQEHMLYFDVFFFMFSSKEFQNRQ